MPGGQVREAAASSALAELDGLGTKAASEGATLGSTAAEAGSIPTALHGGLGGMLLQMGGAVLVVVALILILQKLARRYGRGFGGIARGGDIEVLSQRAIGHRLSLLVVRTHGQTLLIGASPQGIHPVANLVGSVSAGLPTFAPAETACASEPTHLASATAFASEPTPMPPTARTGVASGDGGSRRGVMFPALGDLRRTLSRAFARGEDRAPSSGPADLVAASRLAAEARAREESTPVDLHQFEAEFRDKLRAIRERYPTLEEVEGRAR